MKWYKIVRNIQTWHKKSIKHTPNDKNPEQNLHEQTSTRVTLEETCTNDTKQVLKMQNWYQRCTKYCKTDANTYEMEQYRSKQFPHGAELTQPDTKWCGTEKIHTQLDCCKHRLRVQIRQKYTWNNASWIKTRTKLYNAAQKYASLSKTDVKQYKSCPKQAANGAHLLSK